MLTRQWKSCVVMNCYCPMKQYSSWFLISSNVFPLFRTSLNIHSYMKKRDYWSLIVGAVYADPCACEVNMINWLFVTFGMVFDLFDISSKRKFMYFLYMNTPTLSFVFVLSLLIRHNIKCCCNKQTNNYLFWRQWMFFLDVSSLNTSNR